jgi:hypothetical protein
MLAEKPPGTASQTAHDLVCTLHSTGVKTHGICRGWAKKADVVKARPAQLQFNQAGSWRGALDVDLAQAPPEFLQLADQLARLAGARTKMRVVACRRTDSGSTMPTGMALLNWTREAGWVKA